MIGPIETFQMEAREHLATLESALLELETEPSNNELIDQAFRSMHTIKGAGGMFGYQELTDFTHHLETALDKVRNDEVAITGELIGVMLDAGDHISTLLDNPKFDAHQKIASEQLLERLYALVPEDDPRESLATQASSVTETADITPQKVFRIRFTPDAHTFANGFDVVPILRELHSFGECFVSTKLTSLPDFSKFNPEQCYLSWDLTLVTMESKSTIEDTFMFVADDWQHTVEEIDLSDSDADADLLGELLVARGLINKAQLDAALREKPEIGEIFMRRGLVNESEVEAALVEQKVTRELKKRTTGAKQVDATIRVPAARLDSLMNLVGELVIVQARLNQVAFHEQSEDIIAIAEELDLLTTQMRDQTFSIRMLPIGTTFGRFRRLVRDLSRELGKQISLVTEGAETELDKMVIDKLADPLVHLIRNSIDHGIEQAEERQAAGKPKEGTIRLIAQHAGSQVVIRIIDDGRGLNTQRIQEKAIERQLIPANHSLTQNEIHMLIFEAGFSTAEQVSDISGRGVGMDVVKRSIEELGGKLSLHSTEGEGTELTIQLPMTMAIIEGLMVEVGDEHYVLPLSCVEECIEMQGADMTAISQKRLVEVRGEQIPFLYLREWFDVKGQRPAIEQVVITRLGSERFGFCVDEVIGQYQTVIKRLGKLYEGVAGFSGATILGDGNVAMILDPQALMDTAASFKSAPSSTTKTH